MMIAGRLAAALLGSLVLAALALNRVGCDKQMDEKLARLEEKFQRLMADMPEQKVSWTAWLKGLFVKRDLFKKLAIGYDKLNRLIVAQLPELEDDPETTVARVSEWFAANDERIRPIREATEYFVALKDTLDLDKAMCTHLAEEVFRINDVCTREMGINGDPLRRRRIDRIVHHYVVRHEELCRDKYVEKFHLIMDSKSVAEYQGLLTDAWIRELMLSQEREGDAAEFLSSIMFTTGTDQVFVEARGWLASKIYNALVLAKGGQKIVLGDKLMKSRFNSKFNRLIEAPCKKFLAAVSLQVYVPAQFDMRTSNARLYENQIDNAFAIGWGRHGLCRSILRMGEPFKREVMAVPKLQID